MTPLHVAAKKGLVKALESLVKKGAEIDIKDNKGVRNYICIYVKTSSTGDLNSSFSDTR